MAEEKKEERKRGGILSVLFGEGADRTTTFGMLAVAVVYMGKKIWDKVSEKAIDKAVEVGEKKVAKVLGLEEARKGWDDEFLFRIALHGLNDEKKRKNINLFKDELEEADHNKAEAFVLYVANMLQKHERQQKKSWRLGKNKDAPRVEEIAKLYDLTYTNEFFDDLLASDEKIRFLKKEKVFSLIPPEKKFLKSVGDACSRIADKVTTKKEPLTAEIKRATAEIAEKQSKNFNNMAENAKMAREEAHRRMLEAKNRREQRKKGGK